jgi:ribonucleoside-diphosphate reductase alpha chain
MQRKLPVDRSAITRRFSIPYTHEDGTPDTLKLYVTVGLYEDGSPGEIFIRADKVGTFMSGALDTVAMMFSLALQNGVSLELLTSKMRHSRFQPSGFMPKDPEFKSCSSPFDLVAQWLIKRFIKTEEKSNGAAERPIPDAAP